MTASVPIEKGTAVPPSTAQEGATNWPLLLLIAILPLQNIYIGRIPSLGGGFNFLNLMLLAALLVWLIRRHIYEPTPSPLKAPIYGYIAILVASAFYGVVTLGEFGEGHLHALKDVLAPVILFFVVLNCVRTRRDISWTLVATILPLPYMFRVFHAQLGNVFSWHYDDDLRLVKGTFMLLGSNEIGAFYAAYTFFLIALVLYVRTAWLRVAIGVLAGLNLYCLLYSYSRGSWLAFLASAAVMTWIWNKKVAVALLLVLSMSYGALMTTLPVSVQERFSTVFVDEEAGEERDASAESRFVLAEIALDKFKSSAVFGIGFHVFHHVNPLGKDTHNYYVKVLTEQGLIGIAFLLLIFWRGWRLAVELFRNAEDRLLKALGLGAVGCIVAFAVGNFFGDRFSHYPLASYFWVYLALVQRAMLLATADAHAGDPAAGARS